MTFYKISYELKKFFFQSRYQLKIYNMIFSDLPLVTHTD